MKYSEDLKKAILDENFTETHEILTRIIEEDEPLNYFSDIFSLMENNPNLDYGMPGPVVHFMEKYYKKGYEKELLLSIKRKPIIHTIWMLNRILNDSNLENREIYMHEMENVLTREDVDPKLRKETERFIHFQNNKTS
ncbi:hypothetical protein D6856_12615 [Butyrivibrio sp. XB500-5]|uniref:hypothetical protein n=1 Tax=Butyrivibrio sp. XB500-5 TaxID=2364880 RepID=UPI000EAA5A9F|nr:hypothetical protein [Butyrivibrio sp. XB500-5]RKM58590.1 hypothetical protein D6856_12615 [Butyrivibrio sp. XB500-5]